MSTNENMMALARLAGWAVIPDKATSTLLSVHYRFLSRSPPPPPGSPQSIKAYRIAYSIVICSYLTYNLVHAVTSQQPNFFEILQVPQDAGPAELKSAFRNLARKYHPDKVGAQGEEFFMHLRKAYDTLNSASKRFAYMRFGEEALTWENVITEKEVLSAGLTNSLGFYIGTGFMMVVYGVLGAQDTATLWRVILFLYLLVSEIMLAISPLPIASSPDAPIAASNPGLPFFTTFLRFIFPTWLPFQLIAFLHKIYIALSIAILRLGPVAFPDSGNTSGQMAPHEERMWAMVSAKIADLAAATNDEVRRLIRMELTAIQGPPTGENPPLTAYYHPGYPNQETLSALSTSMEDFAIEAKLRSNPVTRSTWDKAALAARTLVCKTTSLVAPSTPVKTPVEVPLSPSQVPLPLSPTNSEFVEDNSIIFTAAPERPGLSMRLNSSQRLMSRQSLADYSRGSGSPDPKWMMRAQN